MATSFNPASLLQMLRSRSDMEDYLSSASGEALFSGETFKPFMRHASREVEIAPRVGTRVGLEQLEQGLSISYPIPRVGDVLKRLTLRLKLQFSHVLLTVLGKIATPPTDTIPEDPKDRDVAKVLHEMAPLKKIAIAELVIGGRVVDTVHGELAAITEYLRDGQKTPFPTIDADGSAYLYVDLPFFFGRQSTDALPIVKLTQHDVEVRLSLHPSFTLSPDVDQVVQQEEVVVSDPADLIPTVTEAQLFGTFIFLSPEELARVQSAPIYQRIIPDSYVYRQPINGVAGPRRIALPFRGPCSELVIRFEGIPDGPFPPFSSMTLLLNTNEVVGPQPPSYFRDVMQTRHHKHTLPYGAAADTYLIPFGHDGDGIVPDGHVDLTAFDRVELLLESPELPADAEIVVYSRSWNVFSIRDGMGGLSFAR